MKEKINWKHKAKDIGVAMGITEERGDELLSLMQKAFIGYHMDKTKSSMTHFVEMLYDIAENTNELIFIMWCGSRLYHRVYYKMRKLYKALADKDVDDIVAKIHAIIVD